MLLEYGLPREVEEMKLLAYAYLNTLSLFPRDTSARDQVLKRLIFHDRAKRIENMKYWRLTDDQIRTALKQAADARVEELAVVGISPEELY